MKQLGSDKPSVEGEFIPAGDAAKEVLDQAMKLELPHASEEPAQKLIGQEWTLDDLTPEWIIKRAMREATDYGSRTRQSSRVAALNLLAEITQIKAQGLPAPDNLKRAMELPPEERRRLIIEKARQLAKAGLLKPEDLKGD